MFMAGTTAPVRAHAPMIARKIIDEMEMARVRYRGNYNPRFDRNCHQGRSLQKGIDQKMNMDSVKFLQITK
jgi:hypothetical protein